MTMIFFLSEPSDFFPKRLLFFADAAGPETYRPGEAGEAAVGVSEEAAERAAEERRQAIGAAKSQRREERKVKRRDYRLAAIIAAFIQGRDDTMAILLSRLLQRNVQPSILLAVLTLNYPDMIEVLENYLQEERDVMPDENLDELALEADTRALIEVGKELSLALAQWTKRIFTHASFHPMKSIIALAHHHGVDHNMIQLTTLVTQRYFQDNNLEVEFDRMKEFSELFWRDALKRLHHLAADRGLLPEPTIDPLVERDDEEQGA